MANTEGLTDEVVLRMMSIPSPDEEQQYSGRQGTQHPRFPQRALDRREQMMESLGEGEMPAARVIRSSRAPMVHSSSALKRITEKSTTLTSMGSSPTSAPSTARTLPKEGAGTNSVKNINHHKPVIITDSIHERPITVLNANKNTTATTATQTKKISRFKQRQQTKDESKNPTAGGFPSFDIAPVGSLTRKGRLARMQDSSTVTSSQGSKYNQSTSSETTNDVATAAEAMLSNMSIEEIRDGIEEVKSILSAESIEFLRNRKQKRNKKLQQKQVHLIEKITIRNELDSSFSKQMDLKLEERKIREEKEKVAELLSKIRTPKEMEDAYWEAIKLGLAPSLPKSSLESTVVGDHSADERNNNLHTSTSLLRSTSYRQRLLGAKCVCDILEEDVNTIFDTRRMRNFSISTDERMSLQKAYPPLLPVALRCILDEALASAHTCSGMAFLSQCLRSIHSLLKIFVHPHHVVNVNPSTMGVDDPFELYSIEFMNDISRVPSGAELYPPTTITPIDADGTNASCYRADSSAASAESDSKAFYNDPSWVLLSKMRILPYISDVVEILQKEFSSGHHIEVATLQSICGILAMLAVRSPGAALAIANHKGLLPFLVLYCLSPSYDENGGLFDTQNALPFLILLCNLARQSKDVAELEMSFETIMPHLQGILCLQTENEDELEIQIWSITLLRIFLRYGLATDHVQSLISIAAPHVAVQKPRNKICMHFLFLFAGVCDAAIVMQRQSDDSMSSISQDTALFMTDIWLSSSVKNCTTTLPSLLRDFGSDNKISALKMASSQLRLLSSFISAAKRSAATSFVPILSKQSCRDVVVAALESDLLENSLEISLCWSFCAQWQIENDEAIAISLEQEAISCAFVISFMDLVIHLAVDDIAQKLLEVVLSALRKVGSCRERTEKDTRTCCRIVHIARQSWFIEAEYSVLKCLSEMEVNENDASLILAFAVSLIGRLNVGHEAIASFVFDQSSLFRTGSYQVCSKDYLRSFFIGELGLVNQDREAQLEHSKKLLNKLPPNSLRCTADFSAAKNTREDRFFFPVGATWLWNVLSSTMTSDKTCDDDGGLKIVVGIVVDALSLLLHLESTYPCSVNEGAKLYHLFNVCLFPEEILRDDNVAACLDLLFNQLYGVARKRCDAGLVRDFIQECFQHSRLSRMKKNSNDSTDTSLASERLLLDDEMRALDDFVGDLCESFIEFGGQYVVFTKFMRFFLRHDFPNKVTTSVLEKLHPILNVLTIEEETRDSLQLFLAHSMKGGLPSLDSSSRDSSSLLDSFAAVLKTTNKLTRRDYLYILSISYLSRNLASSFQRCERGLEAMKKRLSGVAPATFYDVVLTSKQLIRDKLGTKEKLVSCVIDRCFLQETQNKWQWNHANEFMAWQKAMDYLSASE